MTAVAALLALGMLTVLAGGLSAEVAVVAQPKAIFGACMAYAYATTRSISGSTVFSCGLSSVGIGFGLDAASQSWWGSYLGGQRLSVWLGTRVLTALGVADYADFLAGPVGFAIIAG